MLKIISIIVKILFDFMKNYIFLKFRRSWEIRDSFSTYNFDRFTNRGKQCYGDNTGKLQKLSSKKMVTLNANSVGIKMKIQIINLLIRSKF